MAESPRIVRLSGELSFARAVDEVDACLRQARQDGVQKVLVDIRGLSGFRAPGPFDRIAMVRRWAASAQGRLKVAMVSPAVLNDAERFDIVVARSLGFDGDVFEDEDDALHWLEQSPALWVGPPPTF